jgi:hypothetical protein
MPATRRQTAGRPLAVAGGLSVVALVGAAVAANVIYRGAPRTGAACRTGNALARLELLFGMGKADGGGIDEGDWQDFLAAEVTPRFPEGLTVLAGQGQWRNGSGTLIRERARMLLIFYRPDDAAEVRIEGVRAAYKARFGQESVLRADGTACVSF